MLDELKNEVFQANIKLNKLGLVILTFGNVSGICRPEGLVAIKPSGVDYEAMTANDIVIVDMDGHLVEGNLRPSSDMLTHIELYKAFTEIGGITHTHSTYATMFAQAAMEIPCYGTTHADSFYGNVPVTRFLKEHEVTIDYERNTGRVIIEKFAGHNIFNSPGILVAGHAPFSWGKNAYDSVKNCIIIEHIAQLAWGTLQLNPAQPELPFHVLSKHFKRKNGPGAYYGQKSGSK